VPFEEVLAELLARVEDRQMGVILKRMMLRVADSIAGELEIDALVTGECVAQVSSQTIRNLSIIDRATDRLVFRPLIAADKSTIIDIATQIGTQEFAANMPEYCGVISINPVTRARLDRVEAEEQNFDMTILDRAVESAIYTSIDQLADEDLVRTDVEVLKVPLAEATIIDIRHPDEEEGAPLKVSGPVMKIPFYELHSRAAGLSGDKTYLLYCGKGIMSKLHASYLRETGNLDVKVYAP
jgi:thiamine biosynthesis protein ThiI